MRSGAPSRLWWSRSGEGGGGLYTPLAQGVGVGAGEATTTCEGGGARKGDEAKGKGAQTTVTFSEQARGELQGIWSGGAGRGMN